MKSKKLWTALLVGFSLLFFLASCDSEEDPEVTADPATATDKDILLSGSISLDTGSSAKILFAVSDSSTDSSTDSSSDATGDASITDYKLYCVTFTSPPIAGAGDFATDGDFSVLLKDAAGLAVGCFINDKTTNLPVTTLTFNTGDTSSMGGEAENTSAALKGGEHTMNISFNPETGDASADISLAVDDTVTASITKADISGNWLLTCASVAQGNSKEELALCKQFLYEDSSADQQGLTVYADVVQGTMGGETVYALAPWSSEEAFVACGETEGMVNAEDVTNITSTLSADPTKAFDGIMKSAFYDATTQSIVASDLVDYIVGQGYTNMSTDVTVSSDGRYSWFSSDCSSFVDISSAEFDASLDSALNGVQARSCLLAFHEVIAATTGTCAPRFDSELWYNFAVQGDSSSSLKFAPALGGISVQVEGRFALMPLDILANSAVATDYTEYVYQSWDESAGAPVDCTQIEELTLTMTPSSATEAFGRFNMKNYNSCNSTDGNSNMYGSFFTVWTKQK